MMMMMMMMMMPLDTLTVLMSKMQISHIHCMHMLTAVLVLHLICSSAGCQ
jgi:hypothetical protein